MSGVNGQDLAEADLIRELAHLHRTRHETFLHGSPDALREHSSRLAALEGEYLRRSPRPRGRPRQNPIRCQGRHHRFLTDLVSPCRLPKERNNPRRQHSRAHLPTHIPWPSPAHTVRRSITHQPQPTR